MLATSPPRDNALANRTAVLALARAKLAPLFDTPDTLDALPAWLWSLPTSDVAQALLLEPPACAAALARRIERETDARHPAERYVAYLAAHHPHLSTVQRARLADFTVALASERQASGEEVTTCAMIRRGFSSAECSRLANSANDLLTALEAAPHSATDTAPRAPAEWLQAAGEQSHIRRAHAEGELEIDPRAAFRVVPLAQAEAR